MSILKSKKLGMIVSYIMILANSLSSIILVPFYLRYLGVEGYGFYQMIYSVASYILVLDFGISTTMVRFITEYRVKKDEKGARNFAGHCAVIVAILSTLIAIIGIVVSFFIGDIYGTLTPDKVVLGQKMFRLMIIVLVMTVVEHYFEGIAMAHELFSVAKIIGTFKILLKFVLVVLFLRGQLGVLSLVYVDIISFAVSLAFYFFYDFFVIKFKVRLYCFDKKILTSLSSFMLAIMLQSIVAYLNNTVDKTILGIMLGETASGIYGLAMVFITVFNMLPTSTLTIFLPKATKMVVEGNDMTQQTEVAIKLGRYQMILCGGMLSAFFVVGRDFITLWAKTNVSEIWWTALLIMLPNAIPLIQNYCLNVLDAMKKRLFRSLVLLGLSSANIILTVFMIKWWGILGAAIATAIVYVIGHGIVMNIYYHKKIGLQIPRMWKGILHRLLLCVLLTTIVTVPLMLYKTVTIWSFIAKCLIWIIAYAICLWVIGLNKAEKSSIKTMLKR
jgi:O-antigen/teichoic acid export membrane protein